MYDILTALQTLTTQTATATNSTGVNLKNGTPKFGMFARVRATTVGGTSPTFTGKVQHSDDGTTYLDLASAGTLTAAGVMDVPVNTDKPYVRWVSAITGTNPSIVFDVYLGNASHRVE